MMSHTHMHLLQAATDSTCLQQSCCKGSLSLPLIHAGMGGAENLIQTCVAQALPADSELL